MELNNVHEDDREDRQNGEKVHTAAVMRYDCVKGKPVTRIVAHIGCVEADQVPYLKAAYAKKKPRLVWNDWWQLQYMGCE